MAKFEVLTKVVVNVEAENLEEANKIVSKRLPTASIEYFYNTGVDYISYVVGKCEVSGLSIFEYDDYVCDEDGVMWLKKFDNPDCEHDAILDTGLIDLPETF